ncbi:hypothetical protein [Aeromonas caviae]|uniref:hypothetical protein n=1 Tax=Aeromonas caviae TaxID=648 RepID=UPI0038D1177A
MSKYVYVVSLSRGRSNKKYETFYKNVSILNAKAPDFSGINNTCIIAHHMEADVVKMLCCEGIKNTDDITIEEVTTETLNNDHMMYSNLIEKCFLPYGNYPNISI